MNRLQLTVFCVSIVVTLRATTFTSARAVNATINVRDHPTTVHHIEEEENNEDTPPPTEMKNCRIFPKSDVTIAQVSEALESHAILIKFEFKNDFGEDRKSQAYNNAYRPLSWSRATGHTGAKMLLLPPEHNVLSLYTLGYAVKTIDVALMEQPEKCLEMLSDDEREELIRNLIMNGFQNETTTDGISVGPSESVCTTHIQNFKGTAHFRNWCCHRSKTLKMSCQYLDMDTPMSIFSSLTLIFRLIAMLYSPRLVPESLYRVKKFAARYKHCLKDANMTITRVLNPPVYKQTHGDKMQTGRNDEDENIANPSVFKLSQFQTMPYFREALGKLKLTPNVPYTLLLDRVYLRAKHNHLLPEDYAPVGVFNMIYDILFSCKIRERQSVRNCCEAPCLKCRNKECYWYMFLKTLMQLVVVLLFTLVWLVRLYFYYYHEKPEFVNRENAAKLRHLNIYYPGNLLMYLTPTHNLYLFVYTVIGLHLLLYQSLIIGQKRYNGIITVVFRQCFDGMRETNMRKRVRFVVKQLFKPCEKFGAVGLLVGVAILPINLVMSVIYLTFHAVPAINIIIRFVAHLIALFCPINNCSMYRPFTWFSKIHKDAETALKLLDYSTDNHKLNHNKIQNLKSPSHRCMLFIIIVFSLISFASILFLFLELLSFAIDVFLFTLTGLILNAEQLMVYLSFMFLLIVYGQDSYGSVRKRFLEFNKLLNNFILMQAEGNVRPVMYLPPELQDNEAFQVDIDISNGPNHHYETRRCVALEQNKKGFPRWSEHGLLLFLSNDDQPMIPWHFFTKACKMSLKGVPGDLLISYIRATGDFVVTICFLIFVLFLVFAFGESLRISFTNQMLATAAGGVLPFIFKTIVRRSRATPSINTDSILFRAKLKEVIDMNAEKWPIDDIVVGQTDSRECAGSNIRHVDMENGGQKDVDVDGDEMKGLILKGKHKETNTYISSNEDTGEMDMNKIYLLIEITDTRVR